MGIVHCKSDVDIARWRSFVQTCPQCTSSHRWEWKRIIENSFGWPTFHLMAEESGRVRGILPLVLQKSWIFGKGISSMPLLQGGGIVADTTEAAAQLLREACAIVEQADARYLELRHEHDQGLGLHVRTDKVKALLPMQEDAERLWCGLNTKLRTKIRKAEKAGLNAELGGKELLDEFYAVFSEHMRDLGTPVYGRQLFQEILAAFPDDAHICIARSRGDAVACGFLIGFRQTIECVWSASIRKYSPLQPGRFLTWSLLQFAAQYGYRTFDFGRSTVGSGPQDFKMEWGSTEVPLHWSYWWPNGQQLPTMGRHNPKFQLAIRAWQRVPLAVANRVGPLLVKHLVS